MESDNRSYAEKFESLKFYAPGDEGEELFDATCSLAYQANGIDSEERVEYLYKWAKEQCDRSYEWVKKDAPERIDDFKMGSWGY